MKMLIFILAIALLLIIVIAFAKNKNTLWGKILTQSGDSALLAIFISICSIFIAPYLNQQFEEQRIRSEYILDSLKNLKMDTLQLFNDVQKLNTDSLNISYTQIDNDALKLRYRLLEIESIWGKNTYTEDFQKRLTILLENIQGTPENRYKNVSNFVLASRNLTIYLAKIAKVADESTEFYRLIK